MPWIANRPEREMATLTPYPGTVCVSITAGHDARLSDLFEAVLRLRFEDIDPARMPQAGPGRLPIGVSEWRPMSEIQAKELAGFLTEHRGKNIVAHCAAGISRSGAVVEAVLHAFPEYEDRGWPRHPNTHVMTLLKRALGCVPIGASVSGSPGEEEAG